MTTGKILRRERPMYMEWKFDNFSSLFRMYIKAIASPTFRFAGAFWYLSIHPSAEFGDSGWITVYLIRKSAHDPETRISGRIGIMSDDGTVYISRRFDQHNFNAEDHSKGFTNFLQRSTLWADISRIAPRDEVTFFCRLTHMDEGCREAETQTSESEGACKHVNEDLSNSETEDSTEGEGEPQFSSRAGVKKLSENFKDLFLNEENCDILIKVKEKEFKAHRMILGARSRVFSSMFSHDTIEKNSGIIEISDCEPGVFQEFLLYIYTGKVKKVPDKDVLDLYVIADKYDAQDLRDECVKFMMAHISLETICDILTLALRHNATELLQSATDFFVQNARRIIVSPKWISFAKENHIEANELHIKALDYSYSKEK